MAGPGLRRARGGILRRNTPAADVVGQGNRFRFRLCARVLAQEGATKLEVGQGGAPVTTQRQGAHQLPVTRFIPRRQANLPPGQRLGAVKAAGRQQFAGLRLERLQGQLLQARSFQTQPALEVGAVAGKTRQQFSAIESLRRVQVACRQRLHKLLDVKRVIAVDIELDGLAVGQ